jgi:hypothetical protein
MALIPRHIDAGGFYGTPHKENAPLVCVDSKNAREDATLLTSN